MPDLNFILNILAVAFGIITLPTFSIFVLPKMVREARKRENLRRTRPALLGLGLVFAVSVFSTVAMGIAYLVGCASPLLFGGILFANSLGDMSAASMWLVVYYSKE